MKRTIIFLLSVIFAFSPLLMTTAGASYNEVLEYDSSLNDDDPQNQNKLKTFSEIVYLEAFDDGTVIFDKNASVRTAPASFCKVAAAGVVLEKCSDLDSTVTVTENAVSGYSGFFKAGEKVSVRDLLYCSLVGSSNEAINILALYFGESSEGFTKLMNGYAASAGCKDTCFMNPQGFDAQGQYITALDMAKIIRRIYASEYASVFEKIVSAKDYTIAATALSEERSVYSRNRLMSASSSYYCKGVTGIISGSTELGGNCVAARASRNGYTYVSIVMKGEDRDVDNDYEKENCALIDSKSVLNWAFNKISFTTVVKAEQVVSEVKVTMSADTDHVKLVAKEALNLFVPTGIEEGSVMISPIDPPEQMKAPIKKGEVICKASVMYAGDELAQIELVAGEDVDMNTLVFIGSKFKALFATLAFKIIAVLIIVGVAGYIGITMWEDKKKRKKREITIVSYRDINEKRNKKR